MNSENKILQGDCLQMMKSLPDESVDCIITDPPYGTTALDWDKVPDLDLMFKEFNRVAKPNCSMLIFGQQPFVTDLINSNRKYYRYELIFKKVQSLGFFNSNKMPLRAHENISVFYKRLPTYNPIKTKGKYRNQINRKPNAPVQYSGTKIKEKYESIYRFPVSVFDGYYNPHRYNTQPDNIPSYHPTEKPINLIEDLIFIFSNPNDIILDPFLGSGTTAIAAIRTGRRYIGMELSPEYCDIANKRITQELSHPQLVTMPERSKPVEPESKLFNGE